MAASTFMAAEAGAGDPVDGPHCPNFVIVVLDTVRADHLTPYGYTRNTSPFLQALAGEACLYENAYSTSCWTIPAHASLFTGSYPLRHQAHWENLSLDASIPRVQEILGNAGYRCAGWSGNPLVGGSNGLADGFDEFTVFSGSGRSEKALSAWTRFLVTRDQAPFFAFFNIIEAHGPYNSSGRFRGKYLSDSEYAGDYRPSLKQALCNPKTSLAAERLTHLIEHYDAEVRYVDSVVERIAATLKRQGLWDTTVFIVTADHGEYLGEHGLLGHQLCLYEPAVRIPLLVRHPDHFPPGRRETRPVQLVDLAPTVLELAGLHANIGDWDGRRLVPDLMETARPVFCEYYTHPWFRSDAEPWAEVFAARYRRRLTSVRVDRLKLITSSDGAAELYDLDTDPGETRNCIGLPEFSRELSLLTEQRNQYARLSGAGVAGANERGNSVNSQDRETLRALGYL